jgi:Fic family protein
MRRCLDEWEKSVHDADRLPPLLHIGLLHAQFETIHPFLDGNGRVGRLLVTLLLTERGILAQPLLSLSIFFKAHRDEYYDRLQATRDRGDWESWLRFFVDGVAETAAEATDTVRAILHLRDRDRDRLAGLGRKGANALRLHDFLFSQPVVGVKTAQDVLGVTPPTANSLIADLERLGVLRERTGHKRNRSWVYDDYLRLFRSAADRS